MPATIDRVLAAPRGAVIGVEMPRTATPEGGLNLLPKGSRTADEKLAEAVSLSQAIEVDVVYSESVTLTRINPATLLGGGVVERVAEAVKAHKIEVVIVDALLSPRQQRELEEHLNAKVLDRTGLILDIFARRARTRAGKLQVEVAQLSYQSSRLVRLWTHLERQRGGTGKAGGPGERQIELDKRMLQTKLARVKEELRDVEQARGLQRMARQKNHVPTVALVGYTNAGKSTLFNRMVDAGTLVADALFATLDPLMRKLELEGGLEVVLVDTVGFISDLPHELVEAFKATLEEVVMADLLLHVHDISNPEMLAQSTDVRRVMGQIGAAEKRVIEVYNKIDKSDMPAPPGGYGVSAVTGEGVEDLLGAVAQRLQADWQTLDVSLHAGEGKKLAWLYAHGSVESSVLNDDVWQLRVKLRGSDVSVWNKMQGDAE